MTRFFHSCALCCGVVSVTAFGTPHASAQSAGDIANAMDYGPFLGGTLIEFGQPDNIAYKGFAVKLTAGNESDTEGGVIFDTELLRVAATWSGDWLKLKGTPFDGGHGTNLESAGESITATRTRPGVSLDGTFNDPREIPYGPLPKTQARYRGLHKSGDDVVFEYTVGEHRILEHFDIADVPGTSPTVLRTIRIDPTDADVHFVVAELPGADVVTRGPHAAFMHLEPEPLGRVQSQRTVGPWTRLAMGAPSTHDDADASSGHDVEMTFVPSVGEPHSLAGASGVMLPRLNDGIAAQNNDDTSNNVWFDTDQARMLVDLKRAVDIGRINTFSWHRSDRAPQRYVVYGLANGSDVNAATDDLAGHGWVEIARVNTREHGNGGRHGVTIANVDTSSLGEFRYLLFDAKKPNNQGTFFTEIDVYATGNPHADIEIEAPTRSTIAATILRGRDGVRLNTAPDGAITVTASPSTQPRQFTIALWQGPDDERNRFLVNAQRLPVGQASIEKIIGGGPTQWAEVLKTGGRASDYPEPYVVDSINVPLENPWNSWMRLGGFDFFSDHTTAAVSTWSGDVWIVSNIDETLENVTWKRFAAGLFQPLGLRIVDDVIHVLGRDGITQLYDLNGDQEADHYRVFNNDVYTTRNFHEFSFDLQTDAAGNFYFAKGGPVKPGGRGFDEIVPHHGCVLRVSPDGEHLDVFATGLRAPNGISVSPDGSLITSGDNEGSWMPKCRLNWMNKGAFVGVMDLAHRETPPTIYDDPVCWFPHYIDNSSGGQTWVTSDRWGPFGGDLLHLSYGKCKLFKVFTQEIGGTIQGGVVQFPINFASGTTRARFNDGDGQLYVLGLKGWQTDAVLDGSFQRVRYTGRPANMPTAVIVHSDELEIVFTDPVDEEKATDVDSYAIEVWNYIWREHYGSAEVSTIDPVMTTDNSYQKHDPVEITGVRMSDDRTRVFLKVPDLKPVMQMKISLRLEDDDWEPIEYDIYNTINRVEGK